MAKTKKNTVPSTQTASDLLADLDALVPQPATNKKGKLADWELPLANELQEADVVRWIEAKVVYDVYKARLEATKAEVVEIGMEELAKRIWEVGSRPSNPRLIIRRAGVEDCSAIFQYTDRFKVVFPDVPEGQSANAFYTNCFVKAGLAPEKAELLVKEELIFSTVVNFRPLNELLEGTYGEHREFRPATDVEKSAGAKLIGYVKGQPDEDGNATIPALTPQERAVILDRNNKVRVKAGFFQRIKTYASSLEHVKIILKFLTPVSFPNHAKFGINETPTGRTERLIKAAADVLGVDVEDEE